MPSRKLLTAIAAPADLTLASVAPALGGTQAGTVAFALAIEELAHACSATAGTASVTNMVGEVIQATGSEDQKRHYLPRLADGTYAAGAFCLTEAGAGSDPAGMATRGRRDGDAYVLDGAKLYITSAEYAGVFVVWAVTDPSAPKGRGISCFLIEAGMIVESGTVVSGRARSPSA